MQPHESTEMSDWWVSHHSPRQDIANNRTNHWSFL